jgi:hypothetical protein
MLEAKYGADVLARKPKKKIAVGGDKGYPGIEVNEELFHVLVTDSASRTDELKRRDKAKRKSITVTPKLAATRSVVERTIRRIKMFLRLGSSTNQISQAPILELARGFVCGFINESLSLGELSLLTEDE